MARGASAARRYAEAAFELAGRDGSHERWRDDLRLAAEVLGDAGVDRFVTSRSIPVVERDAAIQRALSSRIRSQTLSLVRLLARRDKLDLLASVAAEFQALLNRQRGVVPAIVTSAAPLGAAENEAVRAKVARLAGTEIDLTTRVDPELIGGLTVRIGDRLIDASVRGRLERLRDDLLARSR